MQHSSQEEKQALRGCPNRTMETRNFKTQKHILTCQVTAAEVSRHLHCIGKLSVASLTPPADQVDGEASKGTGDHSAYDAARQEGAAAVLEARCSGHDPSL